MSATSTAISTLKEARYSHSLERGLALLGCFTPDESWLGIVDMADLTGMGRSTTHRYVITLVALGFLEQSASNGRKYRVGLRVADLGMAALNMLPVRHHAYPDLEELRRQVSYTISLAVLSGSEIVVVDRLQGFRGHAKLGLKIGLGSRLPTYCTSIGKVLLAHLPEDELDSLIRDLTLARHGPKTIVQKGLLRDELAQILAAGFATDDEELAAGVHSIAMPIRSRGEVIAAASVVAPTSMIPRTHMIEDFGPHLLAAIERISASLDNEPTDSGTESD